MAMNELTGREKLIALAEEAMMLARVGTGSLAVLNCLNKCSEAITGIVGAAPEEGDDIPNRRR